MEGKNSDEKEVLMIFVSGRLEVQGLVLFVDK